VRRAAFRRTSSFSEKENSMEANGSVTEEADMLSQYRRCMQSVPAFVPKPGHPSTMKGDFT